LSLTRADALVGFKGIGRLQSAALSDRGRLRPESDRQLPL